MNSIYLQGIVIGLASLAPIGLQNLFVINSAMSLSRLRAFFTALIVSCFDITLTSSCFFGVGALIDRYAAVKFLVLLIGAIVVFRIGLSLLKSGGTVSSAQVTLSVRKTIVTACAVTWLNPQALIDCSLMLGAIHATLLSSDLFPFVSGLYTASFAWFIGLCAVISILRSRFSQKAVILINRCCASVIIVYSFKLMYEFVMLLDTIWG
ncbi:MAG: LysE/ArgO family amino acid transporter [Succinivibrio sp.]